ncbi:D-glycero-beta-D-manno-heptose 1,7-bisphosphate 7-phosphatase [Candidatus Pseudothioglobus singularis]|nr:D-glycero-beta-D-manno-heptose 1,7-bisphosphate 7-phosphatase [Candidatus Pseudothioglobus singularis]
MSLKTIFLDRDGIINQEKNYLYKIDDFEFIDGIFDTCRYFQNLDYKIIIITNQSGISRGYYSERDYHILTEWMLSMFTKNNINILDIFHCPHGPDSNCECRKPRPGMFIEAKNKHNINMNKSWMIGDRKRDITAASLAGITNTILVGSGHKIYEENSQTKYHLNSLNDIRNVIKF